MSEYKIVLLPGAMDDIGDAYFWYENEQKGLGERLLSELASFYSKLEQNPEIYSRVRRTFRQAILRQFP